MAHWWAQTLVERSLPGIGQASTAVSTRVGHAAKPTLRNVMGHIVLLTGLGHRAAWASMVTALLDTDIDGDDSARLRIGGDDITQRE